MMTKTAQAAQATQTSRYRKMRPFIAGLFVFSGGGAALGFTGHSSQQNAGHHQVSSRVSSTTCKSSDMTVSVVSHNGQHSAAVLLRGSSLADTIQASGNSDQIVTRGGALPDGWRAYTTNFPCTRVDYKTLGEQVYRPFDSDYYVEYICAEGLKLSATDSHPNMERYAQQVAISGVSHIIFMQSNSSFGFQPRKAHINLHGMQRVLGSQSGQASSCDTATIRRDEREAFGFRY